jgi:hypothetical protein
MREALHGMAEDIDRKFRAAWKVFAETCVNTLVPEATYQAWFAHYLISQFGIDRVAREPNFHHPPLILGGSEGVAVVPEYADVFRGNEVRLDAVVSRQPDTDMPHHANRASNDRSGIELLDELAVISELKVAATSSGGLDHSELIRDYLKLSMLLRGRERHQPPCEQLPLAYMCVLDNKRAYNWSYLRTRIEAETDRIDPRVELLRYPEA